MKEYSGENWNQLFDIKEQKVEKEGYTSCTFRLPRSYKPILERISKSKNFTPSNFISKIVVAFLKDFLENEKQGKLNDS